MFRRGSNASVSQQQLRASLGWPLNWKNWSYLLTWPAASANLKIILRLSSRQSSCAVTLSATPVHGVTWWRFSVSNTKERFPRQRGSRLMGRWEDGARGEWKSRHHVSSPKKCQAVDMRTNHGGSRCDCVALIFIVIVSLTAICHKPASKEGEEGSSRGFLSILQLEGCSLREHEVAEGGFWRRLWDM